MNGEEGNLILPGVIFCHLLPMEKIVTLDVHDCGVSNAKDGVKLVC